MSALSDATRWLDATDQARLVREGEATPAELVEAAIERIEAGDGPLNAVVHRWFNDAVAAAGEAPEGAPLRGVPTLVKDLHAEIAGRPISNGNAALRAANTVSAVSSVIVERFEAAGLVTLGRSASSEIGSLPVVETAAFGATRNPWDPSRTPGGSSGGAAAAVASGMIPVAHASDGGGSIRIPASCCGLVGLKPSQGRIPMGPNRRESGLAVDFAVSRSVRDSALLLDAVSGPGVGDDVVAPPPARPFLDEVGADPGRLRIGLLDHRPDGRPAHEDCAGAVAGAGRLLEGLGHVVEPGFPAALADTSFTQHFFTLWTVTRARAIVACGHLLGRPLVEDEVEGVNWGMAELARSSSASDLGAALDAVAAYRRAVLGWWADGYDLLLTPTLAAPPLEIGALDAPDEPMLSIIGASEWAAFTPQFNTTGQPAISLPLHWSAEGLPIGVQLVAAYGREDLLIRVAAQLEAAQPWAQRRPPT